MKASAILKQLEDEGVSVTPLPDGRLYLNPRDRLTPELIEQIRRHRAELLTALSRAGSMTGIQERYIEAWLDTTSKGESETRTQILERRRLDPNAWDSHLRQARHAEAIALLENRSRAYVIDTNHDPVVVTLAVRGVCVVDIEIPSEKWDPFLFMQLLEAGAH